MTEERLKEIQKSIFNNLLPTTDVDWYTAEVVNEELELYNEVNRLREIINELKKEISNFDNFKIYYGNKNANSFLTLGAKYYNDYILDKFKELEDV